MVLWGSRSEEGKGEDDRSQNKERWEQPESEQDNMEIKSGREGGSNVVGNPPMDWHCPSCKLHDMTHGLAAIQTPFAGAVLNLYCKLLDYPE